MERNEKLAKWAGVGYCEYWHNSGHDDMFCDDPPPDFEKVDNCIKWLVPKIEDLQGVSFYPTTTGYRWTIAVGYYLDPDLYEGDTLAEAIEKYVDWQGREEV